MNQRCQLRSARIRKIEDPGLLSHVFNEIESLGLSLIESNHYMLEYCDEDQEILDAIRENSEISLDCKFLLENIFETLSAKISPDCLKEFKKKFLSFQQKLDSVKNKID
jgi:hypothetical protein